MPASSTRIAATMPTMAGRPSAVQSRYTSAASSTAMMIPITACLLCPSRSRLGSAALIPGACPLSITVGRTRQQRVAVEHRLRHVHDSPRRRPGALAQELERLALAHPVALHEDALRALDQRPALERALKLLDLLGQPHGFAVPAHRDLDRRLHRVGLRRLHPGRDAPV